MTKIFITHCSNKKDDSLIGTGRKVTPDKLYAAVPTKRFINKCMQCNVNWAIFSDKFGVVFPHMKIPWYNKSPNSVTRDEYKELLKDFETQLAKYDEIWFYHNPGRFHLLYKHLIQDGRKAGLQIILFSHLTKIGG